MVLNQKAWAILTSDEQFSLNLSHIHKHSSWKAGEVMAKAHYKYLELKYRAEHFFKLFSTHFDLYDELIPDIAIKPEVKLYLELTIQKRINPQQAKAQVIEERPELTKKLLDLAIISFMNNGAKSKSLEVSNFVGLVLDFDRWNNFRILPRSIQEPSAYKRRNKNQAKKQLKLIATLPPLSIDILRSSAFCKGPTGFFTALKAGDEVEVFNIRKRLVKKVSELGFYIFTTKAEAEDYRYLLSYYTAGENLHCRDGLKFWPRYRERIRTAINYDVLQNLKPNRKYLEMAVSKLEFYNHD